MKQNRDSQSLQSSWLPAFCLAVLALVPAVPNVAAQEKFIAYVVPAATAGNQDFGGTLGMEFDVNNPVIITRLGVFDDSSDGLKLPISVRLYDRATDPPTVMASLDFTPEDAGELIGGSRFKDLTPTLRLETGFQGTIVAEGYGADERLRNAGVGAVGVSWTTQDGNGSLAFVGTSRYGTVAGDYPTVADEGPAARYCAGTFEYQTTPPVLPGKPVVSLKPGDQQIALAWPAVTQPAPAATYQVLRGTAPGGPFNQIAEVTDTNYLDTALVNGTLYCYTVRGLTAGGKAGSDSAPKCAAPAAPLPANRQIAYFTPATTPGTQNFNGALGMEFDVYNTIIIHKLGVFDDSSDGIKLPLAARIYDRDTLEVKAEAYFWAEDPGVLVEGMRFKAIEPPLRLEAGFNGLIEADGYGTEEKNGNVAPPAIPLWTTNDGNGSLIFVGSGAYNTDPFAYPGSPDGGPANRYAAGTFEYETTAPTRPGVSTLSVLLPAEDSLATLSWTEVTKPLAAAKYRLLRATAADGPWTQVAEVAAFSYQDTGLANGTPVFYKLVAVGGGGEVGADSNVVTVTPAKRAAGVAYLNPAGKDGNQAFGGSLGMDFDVARPVQVTKLGVFDEYSDGLFLTLHAALWDRQNRKELANLEFTSESPGELVDGSRFKSLPAPVVLPAGFQGTIVAYGYGDGERLFNTGNRPDDVALLATFDGASLLFVGQSRYSATPGAYPESPDGGPANRYGAGTFYFEPLAEAPSLAIGRSGDKVKITWTGGGTLESTPAVTGAWTPVPGASSGIEISPTENGQFYRVKQ